MLCNVRVQALAPPWAEADADHYIYHPNIMHYGLYHQGGRGLQTLIRQYTETHVDNEAIPRALKQENPSGALAWGRADAQMDRNRKHSGAMKISVHLIMNFFKTDVRIDPATFKHLVNDFDYMC